MKQLSSRPDFKRRFWSAAAAGIIDDLKRKDMLAKDFATVWSRGKFGVRCDPLSGELYKEVFR